VTSGWRPRPAAVLEPLWEALADFSVEKQIFMEEGSFDVVWAGEII
jgi:hypothetical protein